MLPHSHSSFTFRPASLHSTQEPTQCSTCCSHDQLYKRTMHCSISCRVNTISLEDLQPTNVQCLGRSQTGCNILSATFRKAILLNQTVFCKLGFIKSFFRPKYCYFRENKIMSSKIRQPPLFFLRMASLTFLYISRI